jgi:hypothetical protein
LKSIWDKIVRLRDGQPTIIRTIDLNIPVVQTLKEKDIYVACANCFEYHSDAIHTAFEEYNIPFLSRSDAYNGVNYDEDLRDKGTYNRMAIP